MNAMVFVQGIYTNWIRASKGCIVSVTVFLYSPQLLSCQKIFDSWKAFKIPASYASAEVVSLQLHLQLTLKRDLIHSALYVCQSRGASRLVGGIERMSHKKSDVSWQISARVEHARLNTVQSFFAVSLEILLFPDVYEILDYKPKMKKCLTFIRFFCMVLGCLSFCTAKGGCASSRIRRNSDRTLVNTSWNSRFSRR